MALLIAQKEGGGRNIEIAPEVIGMFQRAEWPGNIRQMHMLIRIAVGLARPGNVIAIEHLPDDFLSDLPRFGINEAKPGNDADPTEHILKAGGLAELEILMIRRALAATKGNVSEAARLLGISRKTIYRKWEKISPSVTVNGR